MSLNETMVSVEHSSLRVKMSFANISIELCNRNNGYITLETVFCAFQWVEINLHLDLVPQYAVGFVDIEGFYRIFTILLFSCPCFSG